MTTSLARSDQARPVAVVDETQPKALQRVALTMPAQQLQTLIQERKDMDAVISQYLTEGVDYGPAFPKRKGREQEEGEERGERNTLLKPGAEKVCNAYNVYPKFEIVEREADHLLTFDWTKKYKNGGRESGTSTGLYRYVVRCLLIHRPTGVIIGEGLGSASTMESKYVRAPREAENTVLKISKKRSHVDATLTAFNLSSRFTQDIEDMHDDEEETTVSAPGQQPAAQQPSFIGFPYPNEHQGKRLDTRKEDGSYLFSSETITGTISFAQKKLASKAAKNPEWLRSYIQEAEAEILRRADEMADAGEAELAREEAPTLAAELGITSPNGPENPLDDHVAEHGLSPKQPVFVDRHGAQHPLEHTDPYAERGTGSTVKRGPDPTSLYALTEKLTGLMKHPAFDDAARARVRHDLVNGMEADEIQAHIIAAEQTIATWKNVPF
jgi:hypothetical protein